MVKFLLINCSVLTCFQVNKEASPVEQSVLFCGKSLKVDSIWHNLLANNGEKGYFCDVLIGYTSNRI